MAQETAGPSDQLDVTQSSHAAGCAVIFFLLTGAILGGVVTAIFTI